MHIVLSPKLAKMTFCNPTTYVFGALSCPCRYCTARSSKDLRRVFAMLCCVPFMSHMAAIQLGFAGINRFGNPDEANYLPTSESNQTFSRILGEIASISTGGYSGTSGTVVVQLSFV